MTRSHSKAVESEFLPFEAEEGEMVRAEITDLGEWLGITVWAW